MNRRMLADLLRPGWRTLRHNIPAFLLLQAAAVALVAAYYHLPSVQSACDQVAAFKAGAGLWFASAASIFSGVILSEFARLLTRPGLYLRRFDGPRLLYTCLYFAWNGQVVDWFYRLQSILFGDSPGVATIATKVFLDQFLATPFYFIPAITLFFIFWECRFRWPAVRTLLVPATYSRRILPILPYNFAYWIPMVSCVYALPPTLQFPLFLFAQAAWNIILLHMLDRRNDAPPAPAPAAHPAATTLLVAALCLATASCRRPAPRTLQEFPPPEDLLIIDDEPGTPTPRLIYAEYGELASLNPLVAEDAASSTAIGMFLGSLVSYDWIKQELRPGLAKSWDISPDGLVYTFHLRRGVRWSDGQPFTADDVLFSYQAYMDERFPNRQRFQLMIDGKFPVFEKIDDHTVRITAPKIHAPFLLFVGGEAILPAHKLRPSFDDGSLLKQWSIATAANHPEELVGLGPYLLESYQPGERIVYVRNPNYWAADRHGTRLPYCRRIIGKMFKDARSGTVAFSRGLTDTEAISPQDLAWVRRSADTFGFDIIPRGPSASTSFIWFNQNPGNNADGKPLVDPVHLAWFREVRFRQAIQYAVDRQGLIDGVLFGDGFPLHSLVSPANKKWYNPDVRQYGYDPAASRRLLQEAGFSWNPAGKLHDPAGHPVRFKLETNVESDIRTEMATVFKENLAALGIEVELKFIDFNTLVVKLSDSHDYEASLLGFTSGAPDPEAGKDIYMSGGRMHLWNPNQKTPATDWERRVDELMILQAGTLDESERRRYFNEVQAILAEQCPVILLVSPNAYAGTKRGWRNQKIPSLGNIYWNLDAMWHDPEQRF